MPTRTSSYHSLTCTKLTLFTFTAVIIQIIGLSLFIVGFFPVKPTLSGMSGLESFYPPGVDSIDLDQNLSTLPTENRKYLHQELSGVPPLFDRLVLMVIDGLPAEFLLGKDGMPPPKLFMESMPYTQSLLARGLAIGYHAKAAPPTVTMPRLKAMVSGAIGGFLDVASNFNTQAFLDDNLIAQFHRIGWKMVMFGDETWLKLFPNMFDRHDGVSSFFVSPYTEYFETFVECHLISNFLSVKDTFEVDYNVSRHLANELSSTDWDLLVLHYLGLDHVGHIGGRNSVLMAPKLKEMDEVIERIHSSMILTQQIDQRRTLLLIVSDHGMTEGGNHGGSSYEETDALALFVSAQQLGNTENDKEAYQVDIAPALALLFGVPIPKNNVGTIMAELFTSLKAEQQLRVLELNSWQLLRLLQTHLTESRCETFSCNSGSGRSDDAERFCCSYLAATGLHESWMSQNTRPVDGDEYRGIVLAYSDFLETASKWLSSRSTDKPIGLLASGIAAMLLSLLGLLTLLFFLGHEINFKGRQKHVPHTDRKTHKWDLDENFVVAITFILVSSMGSSSMVEEEQYIWHFMTSSFYLILLRKTIQSIKKGSSLTLTPDEKVRITHSVYAIIAVLVCSRVLRGWHQGGVNWTYLPDISKLLEHAGNTHIRSLHLLSLVLVIIICSAVIFASRLRIRWTVFLMLIYLCPALMIFEQILRYQNGSSTSPNVGSTTKIQTIYALIGTSTMGILVSTPWLMPLHKSISFKVAVDLYNDVLAKRQYTLVLMGYRDSVYVIGWCYVFSWCLLQMLLQQPINSMPTSLLLVQILAVICYFSTSRVHFKQWVKVATLYYLGMAGHFGLGNTNTLATIDVAGAYIGISSHSTVISGILMFIITYAAPMLALLSMLMDVSTMDIATIVNSQNDVDFGHVLKVTLGYTCLVPLTLNSFILLAYTVVLLLMRNHLFVWSVFSPKYLYVCATTVCVYVGVSIVALTATYTSMVFATRRVTRL